MNPAEAGINILRLLQCLAVPGAAALAFGCGYIIFKGKQYKVHDHQTNETFIKGKKGKGPFVIGLDDKGQPNSSEVTEYNKEKHDELIDWVEEGQRIPDYPNSTNGKAPIHRHHDSSKFGSYRGASNGSHEYQYEDQQ